MREDLEYAYVAVFERFASGSPGYGPECGSFPGGTYETLPGLAEFVRNEDGSYDYGGNTEIYWDGQMTEKDDEGRVTLICAEYGGHEWQARRTDKDEARLAAAREQDARPPELSEYRVTLRIVVDRTHYDRPDERDWADLIDEPAREVEVVDISPK